MTLVQPKVDDRSDHTRDAVLVEPEWLQEHLHDPGLCLVEVDVSPASYDSGHLEGAVLWDVYRDLKDPAYRLVDGATFEQLVRRSGIGPDSTVVFYGYAPAMGFWLMTLFGHPKVCILNCSRETWQAEGRPTTTAESSPAPTRYALPAALDGPRMTLPDVESAIGDPKREVVDVRTGAEYRGERFWPSGAAEPGGPEELRQVFASLDRPGRPDGRQLIVYCTIGGRACTAWFVLTYLLGRPDTTVYDGSWAEWGHTATTAVAI